MRGGGSGLADVEARRGGEGSLTPEEEATGGGESSAMADALRLPITLADTVGTGAEPFRWTIEHFFFADLQV